MAPNPEEIVKKSDDAPMPVERKRIHAEIDNEVDGADPKLADGVAVKKQKKAKFIIVYSALQWEGKTKNGFGRKNAKKAAQEPKEAKDVAAVMEPTGNGLLSPNNDDGLFGNAGFADMDDSFGNDGFADMDDSFGNDGFADMDDSFGNDGFADMDDSFGNDGFADMDDSFGNDGFADMDDSFGNDGFADMDDSFGNDGFADVDDSFGNDGFADMDDSFGNDGFVDMDNGSKFVDGFADATSTMEDFSSEEEDKSEE